MTHFAWLIGTFICVFSAMSALAEPIHLAARKGDAKQINALLASGVPVDQPSTRNTTAPGVSALYIAAQFGKFDAAKTLIDAGADPEMLPVGDEAEGTPMHMAARNGNIEIVTLFLDSGADPNVYEKWAGTPLHQALRFENQMVADLLLSRGAEPSFSAQSISHFLRSANLENGRQIIKGCAGLCHTIESNVPERSLWGIIGSEKAVRTGYDYSDALIGIGGVWSYDDLNSWLAAPSRYAPGTVMQWSVPDDRDRADVIAFLRTLSDEPTPLP